MATTKSRGHRGINGEGPFIYANFSQYQRISAVRI
jgi:hypothetical protein